MPWKLGAKWPAVLNRWTRPGLLRSVLVCAVLRWCEGRSAVTTASQRQAAPSGFRAKPKALPGPEDAAAESSFRVPLVTAVKLGWRRPARCAVAAAKVQMPCVLSVQDHTHSGLAFVVNPGEGTAAALPRACSPQPSTPTNFPDLRSSSRGKFLGLSRSCAALRPSVRRARTLALRITPRPRWARPG